MAVDLHTHSSISDGSDSPSELIRKASALGLDAIALTDHDTLDGLSAAARAADHHGIRLVPGVELSLAWDRGGMHLVVLFLEDRSGPLQDRLASLQVARAGRNDRMIALLQGLGYDISGDEVQAEAGAGVTGRPHIAAVLVRKGYVRDIPAAFSELLAAGRPAYVGRDRLGAVEAVKLARLSGGVPIIAHPHTLGLDTASEFGTLFEELASAGLVGLECFYGDYPPDHQRDLVAMARTFGLVPSGGSDYHGTYKEGLELGSATGDLLVANEVLDELEAAR